jgi:hypothetical protein
MIKIKNVFVFLAVLLMINVNAYGQKEQNLPQIKEGNAFLSEEPQINTLVVETRLNPKILIKKLTEDFGRLNEKKVDYFWDEVNFERLYPDPFTVRVRIMEVIGEGLSSMFFSFKTFTGCDLLKSNTDSKNKIKIYLQKTVKKTLEK